MAGLIMLVGAAVVLLWGTGHIVRADILTVTKTDDTLDGACDADCSLREAITVASAGDTIDIPSGTYTLTLGSELLINKDLTLTGAEAGSTIIQAASHLVLADFRVLSITSGAVAISGVTIQHGNPRDDEGGRYDGRGISNRGSLTLIDSIEKRV